MRLAINPYDKILCYTSEGFFVVRIARLCLTSGTRTKFNQDLGAGLNLRPFLQNVYSVPLGILLQGAFLFALSDIPSPYNLVAEASMEDLLQL